MDNKNRSMFPITQTTATGKMETIGGAKLREEFSLRILCSMLENPNIHPATISMVKVVDMCDELLNELDK